MASYYKTYAGYNSQAEAENAARMMGLVDYKVEYRDSISKWAIIGYDIGQAYVDYFMDYLKDLHEQNPEESLFGDPDDGESLAARMGQEATDAVNVGAFSDPAA